MSPEAAARRARLLPPTGRCWVKVCCVTNAAELQAAVDAGAQAVGLVGEMPSGPGVISDDAIRALAAAAPTGCAPILLTSRPTPEGIAEHVRATGVSAVQVCRPLNPDHAARLRELLPPEVPAIHVVFVDGAEAESEALALEPFADAVLLDSGSPSAAVPRLGGTGAVHDWALSRRIRATLACPTILAGGLRPGNVGQAIRAVEPAWVDVCSGLRPGGALDLGLLADFMREVQAR